MSLRRIVLRDFVIVKELDLDLQAGFTILTGETGAGKSILIDALQLVTGGRSDTGLIREGCPRTEVSAEFDGEQGIVDWLERAGFEAGDTLLLRRTVDSQGKSRGWINGSPCTAAQMRQLGEQLLDIHGQHAWQSLTRADAVRDLLDAFAGLPARALEPTWRGWRLAQEQLDRAKSNQDNLQRDRERLQWQIAELDKLGPKSDEWQQLSAEHTRLSHAQALIDAARSALDALGEGEPHASQQVGLALDLLQKQAGIEPRFQDLSDVLGSALAQIDDACHSLRAYLRHTDLDPQRLDALDQRMGLWMSLARRYRCQPEDLPELLKSWRAQLTELEVSADLQGLETQLTQAWEAYAQHAKQISQTRRAKARVLANAVTKAMQELGMSGGRFEVELSKAAQPMQSGLEDVAFLVAGHAGSSPRPVNKIASGGELSRLALAISVTTSRNGCAGTLIFDEIDAGIGGSVAETVGLRMRQLGQDRQVLAVTHLPQVAACADHHLVVSKRLQSGVTLSEVDRVTADERVGELARMLGGERQLASTLAHARDLLTSSAASL